MSNWTYAPGKKANARGNNPNFVPWAELNPKIQDYDRKFVRLIPQIRAADKQKVCRLRPPDSGSSGGTRG